MYRTSPPFLDKRGCALLQTSLPQKPKLGTRVLLPEGSRSRYYVTTTLEITVESVTCWAASQAGIDCGEGRIDEAVGRRVKPQRGDHTWASEPPRGHVMTRF